MGEIVAVTHVTLPVRENSTSDPRAMHLKM